LTGREEVPVDGRQDGRLRAVLRELCEKRVDRLALIRCERGDVDESDDLLVVSRFGDHRSAVRVTDQDHGAVDRVENIAGDGGVVTERPGGVLHHPDVGPVGAELVVHTSPARSVDETSVDEDDCRAHADSFPG
jgi:hypothetical protein